MTRFALAKARRDCLYSLTGTIISHRGRGIKLGVPTLNFPAPPDIQDGVYAGRIRQQDIIYPAAIFVGAAITFDETERQVEVHVLNQTVSITGSLAVDLVQYIRPNQKFDTIEALRQQIDQDIKAVKQCLPELSKTK